jgi:hypothetical protein
MIKIPTLKKKISSFMKCEEGKISKENIIKVGGFITALAIGSSFNAIETEGVGGDFGGMSASGSGNAGASGSGNAGASGSGNAGASGSGNAGASGSGNAGYGGDSGGMGGDDGSDDSGGDISDSGGDDSTFDPYDTTTTHVTNHTNAVTASLTGINPDIMSGHANGTHNHHASHGSHTSHGSHSSGDDSGSDMSRGDGDDSANW